MAKRIALAVAGLMLAWSVAGYAQGGPAVGAKIGTLGFGLEAGMGFTDSIGGRLGLNYMTLGRDAKESDIEYDVDLDFMSVTALLDWHPFKGGFRVSGGLLYNGNEFTGDAEGELDVGDGGPYPDATLKAKIDFNNIAPYLGIGWDTSFGKEKQFGFICDLGIVFQGSPKVSLTGTGVPADELAKEEKELKDALEDFKFWPVISVGLIYRF